MIWKAKARKLVETASWLARADRARNCAQVCNANVGITTCKKCASAPDPCQSLKRLRFELSPSPPQPLLSAWI